MVFMGLFLLALGILWLLQRLEVITGSFWTYFWPVVVILLGASFIWNSLRWRRWRHWRSGWWGPWERHHDGDQD